jgi:hypothetical protein
MKILRLTSILCCFLTANAFSWNGIGHKLVAQIAYNHLTLETRNHSNSLNHELDIVYPVQSFVNASIWLDTIRYKDIKWYDRMHYVNWSFSKDGTVLPPLESVNALWAIDNAIKTLRGKYANPFDKGIALRILIHVIADIHQPMHATTLVSAEYPKGDAGGNLYRIKGGKLGKNLHGYWDKGGGFLVLPNNSRNSIRKKASEISLHWPCDNFKNEFNPQQWLEESHILGINKAYNLMPGTAPDSQYQIDVQTISEQRVAQAGCRIADLLNNQNYKRGKYYHGRYNKNS